MPASAGPDGFLEAAYATSWIRRQVLPIDGSAGAPENEIGSKFFCKTHARSSHMLLNFISKRCAIAITTLIPAFSSCATDQAAKVRQSRPITLGVWGGAYRPNGNAGFVSDVSGLVSKETSKFNPADDKQNKDASSTTQTATENQEITTSNTHVDVGLHLYPSQRSAFFYGFGAGYERRQTQFTSNTNSSTLTNPIRTDILVEDKLALIGPSIGFDWIWQNGISLLFDIGHRFVVSRQRSITDDGTDSDVNKQERDKTLAEADKHNGSKQLAPSARVIVGYSF